MNNTSVHFITLTSPCRYPECFIRTVIASYEIVVSDNQQDSNTVTLQSSGSGDTQSGATYYKTSDNPEKGINGIKLPTSKLAIANIM